MNDVSRVLEHDLIRQLKTAFGSLGSPRYHFVIDRYLRRPFDDLIGSLPGDLNVEEKTDLNCDLAVVLFLTCGESRWLLECSLVGPWAALLRLGENDESEVVEEGHCVGREAEIVAAVHGHGVMLLGKRELTMPVEFNIVGEGIEPTPLYRIAFSRSELLPWESGMRGP